MFLIIAHLAERKSHLFRQEKAPKLEVTRLLHSLQKPLDVKLAQRVAGIATEARRLLSDFLLLPDPLAYVQVSIAVWTGTCPFEIAVSSCQADRVQNVGLPWNICRAPTDTLTSAGRGRKKDNIK